MSLRLALTAVAVLTAVGCGPTERSVAIYGVPEDLVVTLRAGGAALSHHRVRDRVTARSTSGSHTLHASGPCGEVEVPLRAIDTYDDARLEYEAAPIARRRLLVDTRGASSTRSIAVGALSLGVPVGVLRTVEIPAPACADGVEVRVGDGLVGRLPEHADVDVLVDASGTHCYRLDRADREVVVLTSLQATAPTVSVASFAPSPFHVLGARVDFPFVPVPDRVDLDTLAARGDRDGHYETTSLVPEACPPG